MAAIAGIAVLVALGVYEGWRRLPRRPRRDHDAHIMIKALSPRITMSHVGHVRGGDDRIATGDAAFDGQFLVRGPEDQVRASFDAPLRRGLVTLAAGPLLRDLVLEDGVLTAVLSRRVSQRERVALKRWLEKLTKPLRDPGHVARHLAEAFRDERDESVRRLQLAALVRHHAQHPHTLEALHEASKEADPELRLIAAVALGPDHRSLLRQLALDATVNPAVAARAIAALGEHFPPAEAAALLKDALFGTSAGGAMVGTERQRVALACMAALGARGSVDAVGPLLDVARLHGDPLRREARAAVAAIQSRAPGAGGELSLPESDGGEVALSDAGGEVTLAPPAKPAAG